MRRQKTKPARREDAANRWAKHHRKCGRVLMLPCCNGCCCCICLTCFSARDTARAMCGVNCSRTGPEDAAPAPGVPTTATAAAAVEAETNGAGIEDAMPADQRLDEGVASGVATPGIAAARCCSCSCCSTGPKLRERVDGRNAEVAGSSDEEPATGAGATAGERDDDSCI